MRGFEKLFFSRGYNFVVGILALLMGVDALRQVIRLRRGAW